MTAPEEERERALLQLVRERYEAEGYEVFLHPSPSLLPAVVRDYRPDAVAVRPDDNIIIEVKTGSLGRDRERLRRVAADVGALPNWRFMIVSATGNEAGFGNFEPPSLAEVREHLNEAERLLPISKRATLLIAWAGLESIVRALVLVSSSSGGRAHSPMQVVQQLEMNGLITSDTARRLRKLVESRNAVAHGDLKYPIHDEDVAWVVWQLRDLLSRACSTAT